MRGPPLLKVALPDALGTSDLRGWEIPGPAPGQETLEMPRAELDARMLIGRRAVRPSGLIVAREFCSDGRFKRIWRGEVVFAP
jgi:hypothetical protein